MQLPVLFGLVALALSVSAVPKPAIHKEHETRAAQPIHWVKRSKVDSNVLLPVRIALTQNNLDQGPTLLEEVSTPGHPRYGQHYTTEEIHDLFAPSKESVAVVNEWLHGAGFQPERLSLSANKQWIQLDASVEEVEDLIQTEYYHYEHLATGQSNIGCDKYHVPEHVTPHIDYITPGLKLLAPAKSEANNLEKRIFGVTAPGKKPIVPPRQKPLPRPIIDLKNLALEIVCQEAILPECIKALYNITKPTTAAPGNQLGIFESLDQQYDQADLDEFFLLLAPSIPLGTHPTLNSIDGGTAPTNNISFAGAEADLDFEVSYPIIYPQNSVLYQTDDDIDEISNKYSGFFNTLLDALDGSYCSYSAYGETGDSKIDPVYPDTAPGGYKGKLECGIYKPTNVISISYGGEEFDLPPSYQERQCNEFMKLGMQGVSIILASGDYGVAAPPGDGTANGCRGTNDNLFSPDFPATCPYITTVGATFLPSGANVNKDEEVAVTSFGSGGGFSNLYPIPSYQYDAVQNYFKTTPPPYRSYSSINNTNVGADGGIYNRNGRGYPDVSAIGDNIVVVNKGLPTLLGGTSASAPVFAAIITRINEERIAAGKKTVGFINPTLYANPGAFHDITEGNNPGCNTDGFAAAIGWDPVTGLGTPNYPALLNVFMNM